MLQRLAGDFLTTFGELSAGSLGMWGEWDEAKPRNPGHPRACQLHEPTEQSCLLFRKQSCEESITDGLESFISFQIRPESNALVNTKPHTLNP